MIKVFTALLLFASWLLYSVTVYTAGTESKLQAGGKEAAQIHEGMLIYQQYNCQACHQLFGLGGYLGPELTHAWSDPKRGPAYLQAMLQSGGSRMPNFHFTASQTKAILAYLHHVDTAAQTGTP